MAAPGHQRLRALSISRPGGIRLAARKCGRPTTSRGTDYQLEGCYAARTVARNLTTSDFRRLFSLESNCADESTWEDAEPVSPAPRLTSAMLVATCEEPMAACCTFRAISRVAAPCSSVAAAIAA